MGIIHGIHETLFHEVLMESLWKPVGECKVLHLLGILPDKPSTKYFRIFTSFLLLFQANIYVQNGTSTLFSTLFTFTYYLEMILCEACHLEKALWSFNLPSKYTFHLPKYVPSHLGISQNWKMLVQNTFKTHSEHRSATTTSCLRPRPLGD